MKHFSPLSEWSAPPVRLEDFVVGDAWQALPFDIQVAVARLWCVEQVPGQVSGRLYWTTQMVAEGAPRETAAQHNHGSR
jgi:hypothetical protein